jgi:RimJ/RimL family protein N-acetyltransferase
VPSFPFLSEPLTDGRVVLRDYAERDIPEILIAYQDDPEMHVRLGQDRPPSGAQLGRWAEEEPAERAAGTHATLTILEASSEVCRGQVNVHHVEWEHDRGELGIWLAPQVRGQGLAPRALTLASRWLLDSCGLERVQILTEPDNEPMIRAALAAGFVEEGQFRAYTRERGGRVDALVLSMLPADLRR